MSRHFNITKRFAVEHNKSLWHVSITLHVSGLLTDHQQAHKYISLTPLCMQVDYYYPLF